MSTNNHDVTPIIYVACLAAYNNGRLHGAWIDANQDAEEIQSEFAKMLKASPEEGAEEFAIHGATCKSHLLSEAERSLVQPSGPFLTGACGLGNRPVRSLRERPASWQPQGWRTGQGKDRYGERK